jgi:hypothetical protein
MTEITRLNYIRNASLNWMSLITLGELWVLQDNGKKSFQAYIKHKLNEAWESAGYEGHPR